MTRKLTGQELVKALTTKPQQFPLLLSGMVKASSGKVDAFLFSPRRCSDWVEVPVELVDSVEVLGEAPCDDHAHPLVRLQLVQPTGKKQEESLANILDAREKDWACSRASERLSYSICTALRDHRDDPKAMLEDVGDDLADACFSCGTGIFDYR